MLTRKQASFLTRRLDKIANHVQANYPQMGLSKKEAHDFCLYIDKTSDSLDSVTANTLLREEDETYMDTFDSPHEPHVTDTDEPYMRSFENNPHTQLVEDDDLTPLNDGDWEVDASHNWYASEDEDEDESVESSFNWYAEDEEEESVESSFDWYAEEDEDEDESVESSFDWYAEDEEDEAVESSFSWYAEDEDEDTVDASWYTERRASRRQRR